MVSVGPSRCPPRKLRKRVMPRPHGTLLCKSSRFPFNDTEGAHTESSDGRASTENDFWWLISIMVYAHYPYVVFITKLGRRSKNWMTSVDKTPSNSVGIISQQLRFYKMNNRNAIFTKPCLILEISNIYSKWSSCKDFIPINLFFK